MNRRDLFKILAAAPVAAKAVPLRVADEPVRAIPLGLHPKQLEAWRALHDPNVRCVLFSGGRACGRTHLAMAWADKLFDTREDCIAIFLNQWRKREWSSRRIATKPILTHSADQDYRGMFLNKHVIIEDAQGLSASELRAALTQIDPFQGGKILITTAIVGGGAMHIIHDLFPRIGWNGPHLYHVNAAMTDNPHLVGKWRNSLLHK
jgi:hypothetical protein